MKIIDTLFYDHHLHIVFNIDKFTIRKPSEKNKYICHNVKINIM